MSCKLKALKTAIWIFALFIIQTAFGAVTAINGITADFLLAFAIPFGFLERRHTVAARVIIICAVLAASQPGRIFPITVLVIGLAGVLANRLFDYLRFVPGIIRTQLTVAVTALLMCSAELFAADIRTPITAVYSFAVPYAAYTVAVSCILYLIIKRTIFGKDKKKQLLITVDERN